MAKQCSYEYEGEIYGSKEQLAEHIMRSANSVMPMIAEEPLYAGAKSLTGDQFFYMRSYNPEDLKTGKKTISIRKEKLETGVYKFGEDFYRVSSRGFRKISELKETPDAIRAKFVGANAIRYPHIEEFFSNKLPMYIYDIQKIKEEDYAAMPMSAEYRGEMKVKPDSESLVTGKGVFDNYITAVSDYITRLKDERTVSKGDRKKVQDYTERIDAQESILDQLRTNKSVRFLVDTGLEEMENIKLNALKANASMIELHEGIRLAKAWGNLTDIVDIMKEGKSDAELEVINKAIEVEGEANRLRSKLWNAITEKIIAEAERHNIQLDKLIDKSTGKFVIRDVGSLGMNAISGAFSENELEWLVEAISTQKDGEEQTEHYNWETEAKAKAKELLGNVHERGDFLIEEYEDHVYDEKQEKVIPIKRQGIITLHSRKFHNEYDNLYAKARAREIKWKQFYDFERDHFDYVLTAEGNKAFQDYMEQIRAEYIIDTDENDNYVYDEETIEKIRQKYDPAVFSDYLKSTTGKIEPNSGAFWFTLTPKSNVPINPAYAKLTEKQKQYHTWFANEYAKAYENSTFDFRLGNFDIDELLMDFSTNPVNSLGDRARHAGSAAVKWLKDTVSVVASSSKSGTISRPLTDKQHISVPFRPVIEFIPKHGTKVSPIEVLFKFKQASLSFKHKRQVEEVMNTINDIAQTALKQEENNSSQFKKRMSGAPLRTSSPTNIAARIETSVKAFLTGRYTDQNTTIRKKETGERGLSLNQALDSVNSLTRVRYMALSPLSAAGNFIMGCVNNLTYAASGEYFTDLELTKAVLHMKFAPFKFFTLGKIPISNEAKMIAELMYRYNIIGDVTEEKLYGEGIISKLFTLQKGGEFLVQGASALAQLMHTQVELKDGKKGNLFQLYSLKDGRVHMDLDKLPEDSKWRNAGEIQKVFDQIKYVNQKIHGDYAHALHGKKTVAGRMLFLFRTWLPMAVKDRFGAEYTHRTLGQQKGRYRSFMHLVAGIVNKDDEGHLHLSKDNAINLAKLFIRLIPFSGKFVKFGGKISDLDRRNLDMFVRETQMLLMITMATMMFKTAAGDEDDDDTGWFKYLYNQGERIQSELSMYYTPTSFNQIIRNIVPMTATLLDAQDVITAGVHAIQDPEKDIYQRGFRKGDSKFGTKVEKFLPLTRAAQSTWSAFSQLYSDQPGRK